MPLVFCSTTGLSCLLFNQHTPLTYIGHMRGISQSSNNTHRTIKAIHDPTWSRMIIIIIITDLYSASRSEDTEAQRYTGEKIQIPQPGLQM